LMQNKITPLIFILYFVFISCRIGYTSGDELLQADWYAREGTLTVWALADIQPTEQGDREAFETAIEDINQNVPGVDLAIVAGDIVNDTEEEVFDWYIETRRGSYIEDWYEIIGNHDLKSDRGKLFREKLREDVDYSVTVGNILFIFMSDAERGKATEIPDEVYKWWKELVVNNQDKIIVVTTHAPLEGSGIPFSGLTDRQIIDSERFTEALREYNVDLWLSGHLHLPHSIWNATVEKKEFGGAEFIHLSSIRPEIWGMKESESRVLTFVCGSDKVLVRVRNHERMDYVPHLDEVFTLSKSYECGDAGAD
jgi:predicted MPP superfamily phosphohydrolase